jgi:hypothetical protein
MVKNLSLVLLVVLVPMTSLSQTVTTGNVSTYLGNKRWEWTVFIKADPETLAKIDCVEYLLHPTFPDRSRVVCDRGSSPGQAFPLTATGWGVFDIPVTVTFKDGHSLNLKHSLQFDSGEGGNAGCAKIVEFILREHEIQNIGNDWPGVYIYVQEIHQKKPSRFYLVRSSKSINPGKYNWVHYRLLSSPKKKSSLSAADLNAYVEFSPPYETVFPLALNNAKAAIYVKTPQDDKSISIAVCK